VPDDSTRGGRYLVVTLTVSELAALDHDSFYFEGDGHAILGRGLAATHRIQQGELRSGEHDVCAELRARRTVAFVTFPYDRQEPAVVRIPEQITWSGPSSRIGVHNSTTSAPTATAATDATEWRIRSTVPAADWCAAVSIAVEKIRAGALTKVVLARRIDVEADVDFAAGPILTALRARFPATYLFSVGGLVGASPELLVGAHGGELFARPLAGTVARLVDPAADAAVRATLSTSAKLAEEHAVLRGEVAELFKEMCTAVKVSDEPVIISTAAVHHLASPIRGLARPNAPDLLTIAARLHPTAAVCGYPRESAQELIRALEPRHRGQYAGAVGWIDGNGNGRLAVAIRCIELRGSVAVIWVGNGIVAQSDPCEELAETRAKLTGLVEAVVMP
jgi:isochorismate synthase